VSDWTPEGVCLLWDWIPQPVTCGLETMQQEQCTQVFHTGFTMKGFDSVGCYTAIPEGALYGRRIVAFLRFKK
jgi:hypothetical protein